MKALLVQYHQHLALTGANTSHSSNINTRHLALTAANTSHSNNINTNDRRKQQN